MPTSASITLQGFTTLDGDFYQYTGSTSETTEQTVIRRYSWLTGLETGSVNAAELGSEPDGMFYGSRREAEGLTLYRDPINGKLSLIAGVMTGGRPYAFKVCAYAQPGGNERFISRQLERANARVRIVNFSGPTDWTSTTRVEETTVSPR